MRPSQPYLQSKGAADFCRAPFQSVPVLFLVSTSAVPFRDCYFPSCRSGPSMESNLCSSWTCSSCDGDDDVSSPKCSDRCSPCRWSYPTMRCCRSSTLHWNFSVSPSNRSASGLLASACLVWTLCPTTLCPMTPRPIDRLTSNRFACHCSCCCPTVPWPAQR